MCMFHKEQNVIWQEHFENTKILQEDIGYYVYNV